MDRFRPKERRTIHANGDGTFVVDGRTISYRKLMLSKLPPGVLKVVYLNRPFMFRATGFSNSEDFLKVNFNIVLRRQCVPRTVPRKIKLPRSAESAF